MVLASGSDDGTVRVWRVMDKVELDSLQGIQDDVNSVDWNEDGSRLVCGMGDGSLRVWGMRKDGKAEHCGPEMVIGGTGGMEVVGCEVDGMIGTAEVKQRFGWKGEKG